ncbi:hypothetical protein ACS0TY_031478 [Phlomoides rotata]
MRGREGEAESGVDFRNLDSEWTPVRQRYKPSYPRTRIDMSLNETRTNWIDVWNPNRGCVTLFFTNFPTDCSTKALSEKFNKIDLARDIFVPNRLDKKGKAFGFVRFRGNTNRERLEWDLNNIWIGSYKLRENISKFARKGEKQAGKAKNTTPDKGIDGDTRWKLRFENKTYLQAAGRRIIEGYTSAPLPEAKDKFVGLAYKSSDEDRQFLSRLFTGQLKEEFPWWENHRDIQYASEGRF